ncbi:MAG: O-acetyl-ADP-ribose deacetylase [Bacteroidales bacterium]|nr:O-acetyl-ADP-ribose deacetylase [Bacteroidales bacterium]
MEKHHIKLSVHLGDITKMNVECIVNAANSTLLGGGGVDGAIHRAAGPALREYCATLGGCPTGEAKITPGFNLSAKYIIHTVGPIYKDGKHGEDKLLYQCYKNSLLLAHAHKIKEIAFPGISTGIYSYPIEEATDIAIQAVLETLQSLQYPDMHVIFVAFNQNAFEVYQNKLMDRELNFQII